MDIELAKKVAILAVKEAGKLLNDNFQKVKSMSFKGENDIVTQIDLKSEKVILGMITSHFSDHDILSEEAGSIGSGTSKYTWVIDPIDGTVNYYHGMNPYRVGICLLEDKKPVLNVLYNPTKDEAYVAQKGRGAFLNDRKIAVNNNADLKKSVVMFHLSSRKESRTTTMKLVEKIANETMRMRMYGSSLSQMSYIANGKFDIYFNVSLKPWDILPAALLVQEAGGMVTDVNGKEVDYNSTSVLATNGRVHEQMLKLLQNK